MYTYLALGDSYTYGEAVEPSQTFPNQLTAKLREQGIDIADPKVIAVTGWTTDELQAGIKAEHIAGNTYDLVTLLIGVNNQYRGVEKGYTLEGYKREFIALLQAALAFAGGNPERVIVVSIPDWGATPSAAGQDQKAIAADINAYNAVNRQETERIGAPYVDITPLTRQAAHDRSLIAPDDQHYSGSMHAKWVEAILPSVSLRSLKR